jgi:3-hydroxybutyryl-CoA dehydrogenase
MGAGIAQVSAAAGYQVLLFDSFAGACEKALKGVSAQLQRSVEKGKLSPELAAETTARLRTVSSVEGLAPCDLVIEAVREQYEVKAELFARLDQILAPGAFLASNTSMKLIELIRGLQTSDETYEKLKTFSESLGKTTVLAVDGAGFVVNRILCPMINEAIFLVQEGVKPEDIDTAMQLGTNQPMGPLTLADFVGLDTLLYILQVLHRELGEDKYRPCPLLARYVEAGWFGKKNGRGFYRY